jgi:hypothetical protein
MRSIEMQKKKTDSKHAGKPAAKGNPFAAKEKMAGKKSKSKKGGGY